MLKEPGHKIWFQNWMSLAACAWLGCYPLMNFGSYSTLTIDKWHIMLIMTGTTIGCFAADFSVHQTKKPPKVSWLLICLLFFWIILSCLTCGTAPSIWWTGIQARREGLGTQLCYLTLFLLFSCSRIDRKSLLGSSAAGVIVFGLIVFSQRIGNNPFHLFPAGLSIKTNPEFQGTIGNVDMCTGYLVLFFGILSTDILQAVSNRCGNHTGELLRKKDLTYYVMCLVGAIMSLFLTISMGVQFGAVSIVSYLLYCAFRMLPRRFRLIYVITVLSVLLLFVWFCPFDHGGLWELHEIMHGRTQLSFGSNRLAAWYYSILLGKESLLLGGGSGTFMQRLNNFLTKNQYTIPSSQGETLIPTTFDSPHNEYIAYFVNNGLPAMIFFAALIVYLCFNPVEGKNRPAEGSDPIENNPVSRELKREWLKEDMRSGMICYAVQAFFSFSVCIVAPMFWIVIGVLSAENGELK